MNNLNGKIAVITGGTSGIGAACAEVFASSGAKVVVAGRNSEAGNKVIESIISKGFSATYHYLDIKDDDSIKQLADSVYNQYGQVDILFNNAGIYPIAPSIDNFNREDCNELFNVNITSAVMVTKMFLPFLMESHGVILNNASIAGLQNFASGQSYAYSSSKSAVIQFTKMFAKKYGEFIRVNCICPGVIDTPLYTNLDPAKFIDRIPLRRVGTPLDIAKVANFLVSEDAGYINGAVITVDGGLTL